MIVTLDTDMALPEQVDTLHIEVISGGKIWHQQQYPVGLRTENSIPATLDVTSGSDEALPVTVRVAGSKATVKGLEWRTFRETITTVPTDRIANLRMPIQWLCKGQVEAVPQDPDSPDLQPSARSTCGEGFTCKAGRCQPSKFDVANLPDYTPELVYGGGADEDEGSCFDTLSCMMRGAVVAPDADCTIPKPASEDINVALRVSNDGICDSVGVNCFVPLNGLDPEGWQISEKDKRRLTLPEAACEKLDEGAVRAVYVSTACKTKTPAVPACGPWSNVPKGDAGEFRPTGEVSVSASTFTSVPAAGERCCPLMAEADKLYACVCSQDSNATLFEIDPLKQTTAPQTVGAFNPTAPIASPLATTIFDHSLYWVEDRSIRRTPLPGSSQLARSFFVQGALYDTGSLLVDENGIYALASGVSGMGSAVRLFVIDSKTEQVVAIETGGNGPVFQFDHDQEAVYLAVVRDQKRFDLGRIDRGSSVVRIAKRGGQRTTLMPERSLQVSNVDQGGYLGVRVAAGSVYALYEDAVAEDGTVQVHVYVTRTDAAGGEPEDVYQVQTDPARRRLRLLGSLDGAIFLSQLELHNGVVAGAALLMLPADHSAPRVLADFARDHPLHGLAQDATYLYWLNSSGAVYRLPRSALR